MNPIDRLTELFKEFPGIGPRQARRFVYFLLRKNTGYVNEVISLIPELKKSVRVCKKCQRYFSIKDGTDVCNICNDTRRDSSLLMVVSRDTDMESVEKSGEYDGYYFVLGGIVPILEEQNANKFIRLDELRKRIEYDSPKEVIIATNANPDGDNTALFLKKNLSPLLEEKGVALSTLGRGLSTGTELEYSDQETIGNALKNRH